MKLNMFRELLIRNKVLFETVAASLLSVMAIIVSIVQTRTSSQQTEIFALQTRIIEAQALPQFEVAIHQKRNDVTEKFDDNLLVVKNNGGAVHNFYEDSAYFFCISAEIPGVGFREIKVPIGGYFISSAVSSAGTGDLVTTFGFHNNASFINLYHQTRQAATAKKWPHVLINEQTVVHLRYRDLLDRQHEDYYDVSHVGAGMRMLDLDGKLLFDKWRIIPRLELSTLNAEDLLTIVAQAKDGKGCQSSGAEYPP